MARSGEMEVFVRRALTKIIADGKKSKPLLNSCEKSLGQLESGEKTDALAFFEPLRMACRSKIVKVVITSIDCIQKLIAYGYLRCGPSYKMIIDTICDCSLMQDDNVQLQVIKALLTAVTSNIVHVHDISLLHAVRSCYRIYLVSKNEVNKTTAKATLQQMTAVVFQRMETAEVNYLEELRTKEALTENQRYSMYPNVHVTLQMIEVEWKDAKAEGHFKSQYHRDAYLLFRALCRLSMRGSFDETSNWESNNTQSGTSSPPIGSRGVNGSAVVAAASSAAVPSSPRAATTSPPDPITLRAKLLSLELLIGIVRSPGQCLKTDMGFTNAFRNYLCQTLLRNCVSNIKSVMNLSLRIFLYLVDNFYVTLKTEIEVFISHVFLKMLESENASSMDHKLMVLDAMAKLCSEFNILVDIFVSYDCNFETIDLFQSIVYTLAKIAKEDPAIDSGTGSNTGTSSSSGGGTGEDAVFEKDKLRKQSLHALVLILETLLKGCNELNENACTASQLRNELTKTNELGTSSNDDLSDEGSFDGSLSETSGLGKNDSQTMLEAFDIKQKRQQDLETGILKFNLSPAKGILYLESRGYLKRDPKIIAEFLHKWSDKLDKSAIGEFLGKEREYQDGFCVQVLHEYIDMLDFSNLVLDEAIRHFLSGFRLPGEAQKIDRIMEKFAERFCLDNPTAFENADTAFILSFSIIMLQTDLHNPAIREDRRMTKADFVRTNRGIHNGQDLDQDFLEGIYDRIANDPISLKEDEAFYGSKKRGENGHGLVGVTNDTGYLLFGSGDRKRAAQELAFELERKSILLASEALIRSNNLKRRKSRRASVSGLIEESSRQLREYVRPMFEVAWWPMIGAFSQVLEQISTEADIIELCLKGVRFGIHLSAVCMLDTARETFVNGLTKYTSLVTVKEMEMKNIECIKTLIRIALDDGNYLMEDWYQVLHCISQLARLALFANGKHPDDDLLFDSTTEIESVPKPKKSHRRAKTTASGAAKVSPVPSGSHSAHASIRTDSSSDLEAPAPRKRRDSYDDLGSTASGLNGFTKLIFSSSNEKDPTRLIEETNAKLLVQNIDFVLLDRVFVNSTNLNSEAIQDFVLQLCRVSESEITNVGHLSVRQVKTVSDRMRTQPRVYCLQKLVEVADFNMDIRSRLVWSSMWTILSRHFAKIGCISNQKVAMFAVDSLRQLSTKFLQKDELKDFNFQRLFMKPFETIVNDGVSTDIHEFVLASLENMFKSRGEKLRSGWKTYLDIFSHSSNHEDVVISDLALHLLDDILQSESSRRLLVEMFLSELIRCLLTFINCRHLENALRSIDLLVDVLSDEFDLSVKSPRSTIHREGNAAEGDGGNDQGTNELVELCWPAFVGLSQAISDPRLEIRKKCISALDVLFRRNQARLFSHSITCELFFRGILFPILDNAYTDASGYLSYSSAPHEELSDHGSSRHKLGSDDENVASSSWLLSTGSDVFALILDLYTSNLDITWKLSREVFSTLKECMCADGEYLARLGVYGLEALIKRFLGKLSLKGSMIPDVVWEEFVEMISFILKASQPVELASSVVEGGIIDTIYGRGQVVDVKMDRKTGRGTEIIKLERGGVIYHPFGNGVSGNNIRVEKEFKNDVVMTKLVVLWRMIKLTHAILKEDTFMCVLSDDLTMYLLEGMVNAIEFAGNFNDDLGLRKEIRDQYGFMKQDNETLPDLYVVECTGYKLLLGIVFPILEDGGRSEKLKGHAKKIIERCTSLLVEKVLREDLEDDHCSNLSPLIVEILNRMRGLNKDEMEEEMKWFVPNVCSLVRSNDSKIREEVHSLLMTYFTIN